MRRAALSVALALALLPVAGDARGAGKKGGKGSESTFGELPAWVKEAHARIHPPTDADLVWLHDETRVERDERWGLTITQRVAARVLRESGLDRVAARTVYYTEGDRVQDPMNAWTVLPDERVVLSDPEDDVRDDAAVGGGLFFNDARARTVFSRSATVGSVVAFETRLIRQLDLGTRDFVFGDPGVPTAYARFSLQVPEGWTWDRVGVRDEGLEIETSDRGFTATARDLAPVPDEEFAPPVRDRMPRVWARWRDPAGEIGFADWAAVNRWYRDLAEPTLDDPGEAAEIGARLRPAEPAGLLDALERAFAYVAREIRYVSIDIGLGLGAGFKPDTPAKICAQGYGDCKDKSFLIRALTRPWDVESYPVLVRTRGSGRMPADVPSPDNFNHCIAAVKLPEGVGEDLWSTAEIDGVGRVVFLDATVRLGSPWALRSDVQGTTAFVVHPGGGTLVDLPVQPPDAAIRTIELRASLQPDGALRDGSLRESWTGTRATNMRYAYSGLTEEQRRRAVAEELTARVSGASIARFSIEGLDEPAGPVERRVELDGGRLAQSVGDLLIVGAGAASRGVGDLSLSAPPRRWPLVLSNPYEDRTTLSIELPAGWIPEELPGPVEIDDPRFDARAVWEHRDGALVYERRLRMRRLRIAPDDYPSFRESLLALAAADRQSIVLIRE